MTGNDFLDMFTIYERPRDYPNGYVVRRSVVRPNNVIEVDAVAQYAATLGAARALVPVGKIRMARDPNDDPAIVEVWL